MVSVHQICIWCHGGYLNDSRWDLECRNPVEKRKLDRKSRTLIPTFAGLGLLTYGTALRSSLPPK